MNPETPNPWWLAHGESREDYAARIAPEVDGIAAALAEAPKRCWKKSCRTKPKYLVCFEWPYRMACTSCKKHSERAWPKSRPPVWPSAVFNIKTQLGSGPAVADWLLHFSDVRPDYNPMLGIERYLARVAARREQ
jgi:hypothetical protein